MFVYKMLMPTLVAFELFTTPLHKAFILFHETRHDKLDNWAAYFSNLNQTHTIPFVKYAYKKYINTTVVFCISI